MKKTEQTSCSSSIKNERFFPKKRKHTSRSKFATRSAARDRSHQWSRGSILNASGEEMHDYPSKKLVACLASGYTVFRMTFETRRKPAESDPAVKEEESIMQGKVVRIVH